MAAFTYWKMFYLKTPSSLSTYYSPLLCIGLLHVALLSPVFASLHRVATSHFAQIIASWRRSPYFGLDAVSIQELVFSNDYRFYDRHDQPTVTSVSLLIFYASGYVEKFYILCKKYSGQDSKHDFIKIDQTSQERKQNNFVLKVTTWKKPFLNIHGCFEEVKLTRNSLLENKITILIKIDSCEAKYDL